MCFFKGSSTPEINTYCHPLSLQTALPISEIKGHDARSLLPQVETPTLVIAGANDAAVPTEAVRATAALIPSAAFEVVTGAAHQVPMQHPVAFADRLCRHISGAPR